MTRPVTEAFPLSGAHATFQWPRSANGPDAVRLPERLVDFSAPHHGPGLADLPGQDPPLPESREIQDPAAPGRCRVDSAAAPAEPGLRLVRFPASRVPVQWT